MLNGSVHMPLTYHILEKQRLMYQTKVHLEIGELHYTFKNMEKEQWHRMIEVPVMSTCGMMIHKKYFEMALAWPSQLGIYGGGENYINYVMAIMGLKKYVYDADPLCHLGDRRSYHWNADDYNCNRIIANYCVGGEELALKYTNQMRGSKRRAHHLLQEVIVANKRRREEIKRRQKLSIEQWLEDWRSHESR